MSDAPPAMLEEAIENVGIEPDIPIADTVDDPVGVVRFWLERRGTEA